MGKFVLLIFNKSKFRFDKKYETKLDYNERKEKKTTMELTISSSKRKSTVRSRANQNNNNNNKKRNCNDFDLYRTRTTMHLIAFFECR